MKLFLVMIIMSGAAFSFVSCADLRRTSELTDRKPAKTKNKEFFNAYNRTLMHWQVPYREMDIVTSYGIAHVIVSGPENGVPLVLLHGLNASSTMWYPNIKSLAQNYRVYAIDNINEPGKSVPHDEITSVDTLVAWYAEVIDKLKLQEFALIGASKGGWMATKLAIQMQPRIKKLVLLSPLQTFVQVPRNTGILKMLFFQFIPSRVKMHKVMEAMSTSKSLPPAFFEQVYLASKMYKPKKPLLQVLPFSNEELKSLQMPVLLLIGDKDIINNDRTREKAKEILPDIHTDIIENAGHFLSIDQAELVNVKILGFLHE